MAEQFARETHWDDEAEATRIAIIWSILLSLILIAKHLLVSGGQGEIWLAAAVAALSVVAAVFQFNHKARMALALLVGATLGGTVLGVLAGQSAGPLVWTMVALIGLVTSGRYIWAAVAVVGLAVLYGACWLFGQGAIASSDGQQAGLVLLVGMMAVFYIHHSHALTRFRHRQIDELRKTQRMDALTGALNRRGFTELMDRFPKNIRASGNALLLLDLDEFKAVNDTHGHPFGDSVLIWLAEIVQSQIRKDDRLARLGGDEFAVVLTGTSIFEATGIANRIHAAIGNNKIVAPDGTAMAIRATIGLAHCASPDSCSPEKILSAADQALYEAKRTKKGFVTLNVAAERIEGSTSKVIHEQTISS